MSENKIIVKNSLILYIRLIITSAIGFISARYVLVALGASDYGLYAVVGGIVSMMAFLNNIMVSTTYRFVAFELGRGRDGNVNKVFNISITLHLLLAFITLVLAETVGVFYIKHYLNVAGGKIPDALFVFRFSVLATFTSIISIPYQGLITAKEKFIVPASIAIGMSALTLIVVLLLQNYTGNRLRVYAFLIALISLLPALAYFLYSKRHYAELIKWNFQRDRKKYKEMLGFGGWILLGASASASESYISAIIINVFFGTFVNAAFGIANQVNNIIKMFAQSLNSSAVPQITKSFGSGNITRTMDLVILSSKYSFFLMMIPAFPILLETKYIMNLWLKEVPDYTVIFVQIMIVNALISIMNAGIPAAVQATGTIKFFQIILSLITLLALPVSYYLFKTGAEPYMMPMVFTGAAIVNFVVMQFLLKRLIKFDVKEFFLKAYLKMFMITIPMLTLFVIKSLFDESFLRLFILSASSTLLLLVLVYTIGMSQIERNSIHNYIRFKFRLGST